ncbi:MAG: ABC transporter ATP-binding protein, partial [Pirellulales bacterium]
VYELVEEVIGVVWSTSYLDEAERCASVLLLNEGQSLYHGPPKELTARVEGRSFLVYDPGEGRRKILAAALRLPDIVDGVIQGSSVRLVLQGGAGAPTAAELGSSELQIKPTPPRFEDAFVDLLGGVKKGESPFGDSLGGRGSHDGGVGRPAPNIDRPAPTGANGDAVVEARALTKRFGDFTAAEEITFQIARGEIFGLLGPNGAGKSTTFKMMCGLLKPNEGSASVAGHDLYRAGAAARAQLGYMAQKFSLYGDLSVEQNLRFFAGIYGVPRRRRGETIDRMIDAFGLADYLNKNSGELPLGFKQRLALACALMHDPAVLFLDEPTSGVDPLTRREFWSHINALVERGVTVLVTTHFMDEAEYCDRVGLIYQGHLIAEGSPDDLKARIRADDRTEPTLEDAFIALVEQHDRA